MPAIDAAREADIAKSIPVMHSQPPANLNDQDESYRVVFDRIHQLAQDRDEFFARATADSAPSAGKQQQKTVDHSTHAIIKNVLIEGIGLEHAASSSLADADVDWAKKLIRLAAENQKVAENLQQQLLNDGKKPIGIEDMENVADYKEKMEKLNRKRANLKPLPDLDQLYQASRRFHKGRLAAVAAWKNPTTKPQKEEGFFAKLKRFLKKISIYHLVIRHARRREAIHAMSQAVQQESQSIAHIANKERAAAFQHLVFAQRMLRKAKYMQHRAQEAGLGSIDMEKFQSYTKPASKADIKYDSHSMGRAVSGLVDEINKSNEAVQNLLFQGINTKAAEEKVKYVSGEIGSVC